MEPRERKVHALVQHLQLINSEKVSMSADCLLNFIWIFYSRFPSRLCNWLGTILHC